MVRIEREGWIARIADDGNGRPDLRAWLGVGGAVISEVQMQGFRSMTFAHSGSRETTSAPSLF
jgi:hypothetical protein